MKEELIYRVARKGDEEEILKVIEVALNVYGLKLEPEDADADVVDLEEYYFKQNGWFEVVEFKGKIIGSVGVYHVDDQTCELRKMYLYPQYQGMGIGKQLMEDAIEAAREIGFSTMLLQTSSKLVKALPLYEQYGFVMDEEGEVCTRCDIAMIKHL